MRTSFLPSIFLLLCGTTLAEASWPKGVRQDACKAWANTSVALSGPFEKQGHAYVALIKRLNRLSDGPNARTRSPFLLCEGDQMIGRPHASHDDIRSRGKGRFSHWETNLYFSTSDNTDPDYNGRSYHIVRAPVQNDEAEPSKPAPGAGGSLLEREAPVGNPHGCTDDFKGRHTLHLEHQTVDKLLVDEHTAALDLAPDCAATDVAARSGAWSNPGTWRDQRVPGFNARVAIPAHANVVLDTTRDAPALDWIRVDGRLSARTDRDTALALRTLIVSESGHLELGTEAAPIPRKVKAWIDFVPRLARNRSLDPFDLAGGLVSHGTVHMVAASRTAHRQTGALSRGSRQIEFAEAPHGWDAGDRLLIPGTDAWSDQDEVRTITAIRGGGLRFELDQPLMFDHDAPAGASIRIGNLTRNIELRSRAAAPLGARAHVMFMHTQSGTLIDGAAFVDLGRTDTRVGHTIPSRGADGRTKPGTDANTIGRYPVHFHVRSGARVKAPPHIIRNSVVINSPKFGIVNHGAHVLVEDNITFQVEGSHLMAENGSEIGAFRGNMAVRSNGSGDPSILSRMGIYDNAHGGNGIWLTSGGVEVVDNWASGHADSGFKMLASRFFEQGREIFFDGRNIGNPPYADREGRVNLMDVNLRMRGNVFVASAHGMEIWNHKEIESHDEISTIDDTTIWNTQSTAVFVPYTRKTTFRNLRVWGAAGGGGAGIDGNRATGDITIDGGHVKHFTVGIRLPQRGRNVLRNVALENEVGLEIKTAVAPGRRIHLDRIESHGPGGTRSTIAMGEPEMPFSGDAAVLFSDDRIDLTDDQGRNQRLYFPAQHPNSVPFADVGPAELRGLTTLAIHRNFGLALGGTMAPESAMAQPRSNALFVETPRARPEPRRVASRGLRAVDHSLYDPYGASPASSSPSLRADAGRAKFDELMAQGRLARQKPSRFLLHPSLQPPEIHPDDVPFGYRILGYVVDDVNGRVRMIGHFEEFRGLKVDPDGFVRVRSQVSTVHGRYPPQEIAIRVSDKAVRRAGNLDYFLQARYCGACGFDVVEAEAERAIRGSEPPKTAAAPDPSNSARR